MPIILESGQAGKEAPQLEEDMQKEKYHELGGLALEQLSKTFNLINNAIYKFDKCFDLSIGLIGGALSKEELKKAIIDARVDGMLDLEEAREKILGLMEMISHEF